MPFVSDSFESSNGCVVLPLENGIQEGGTGEVNGVKRKRTETEPEVTSEIKTLKTKSKAFETLVGISPPPLTFPESAYEGYTPPLVKSEERDAIDKLLEDFAESTHSSYADADFISFELDDFTIHRRDLSGVQYGMVSLNDVATKEGEYIFLFDGIVKAEGSESAKFYLERITFSPVSIGGYEDVECHTVGSDIWIQSTHCRARGPMWYKLGQPSSAYHKFYHLFLWVADLAKHFVDYLHGNDNVTLNHFRQHFFDWVVSYHKDDATFSRWLSEYGGHDFRHVIVAHGDLLQKQAFNLDISYADHLLWDEIGLSLTPIVVKQPTIVEKTVVTPYVYKCFRDMAWSDHLQPVQFSPEISAQHQLLLRKMNFLGKKPLTTCNSPEIAIGDVISLRKEPNSIWKGNEEFWHALVQGIRKTDNRPDRLNLIWLYRPADTVCADLTYPHQNELFLSDHCNCNEMAITTRDVVRKENVDFYAYEMKNAAFFIRQTYHVDDETFTTLKKEDFRCSCGREEEQSYGVGDTVLARISMSRLTPAEIVAFEENKGVRLRLLPCRSRAARDFEELDCAPNELVYTNDFRTVHRNRIQSHCHIRFYSQEEKERKAIPAPYNRDGNGNAYYIIYCKHENNLLPIQAPKGFRQGFDPLTVTPQSKLRALNIFSGGGNFDRGLEEGSAIQSEWAVEWGLHQMLTYRANNDQPDGLKLFCGSVNDYLIQAIQGKDCENSLIAKLGEVQFISGGSPCQGYSIVNSQKGSDVSMRNSSMIASVAAYVDLYRPMYAVLENVPAMAHKTHKRNPLSQLLCAFVGMAYQVRLLNLDAWSYGAPQSRSRLFIVIAAPGLHLPDHPRLTHSHPNGTPHRSLGEAPNGLPFGKRKWDIPVFDFVSAAKATRDLPPIPTARVMSISTPDHRPSRTESAVRQTILSNIPKAPVGSNLTSAIARGWVDGNQFNDRMRKASRAWTRVNPHTLIGTITTVMNPSCKFTGRWLHWQEDRLITVMEARRAQGFPDSEIITGSPAQQWKIVGNSVSRHVSLALGLVIREACLRNKEDGTSPSQHYSAEQTDTKTTTTMATRYQPTADSNSGENLSLTEVTVPGRFRTILRMAAMLSSI